MPFPPCAADPQGTPCPCVLSVDDRAGSGFPPIIDALSEFTYQFARDLAYASQMEHRMENS